MFTFRGLKQMPLIVMCVLPSYVCLIVVPSRPELWGHARGRRRTRYTYVTPLLSKARLLTVHRFSVALTIMKSSKPFMTGTAWLVTMEGSIMLLPMFTIRRTVSRLVPMRR